jgi:hypothetical protein
LPAIINGVIQWCREDSTMYLSFSQPKITINNPATKQEFGKLFASALAGLTSIDPIVNDRALDKDVTIQLAAEGRYKLFVSTKVIFMYDQITTAVRILQNYVYVSGLHGEMAVTVMEGNSQLGYLVITNS